MATGTELATAYVSLVPSTSGLGKAMKEYFSDMENKSEETGKRSGSKFTAALGKWAKRGAAVGMAAVGAAAGAAVVTGFRSAIDQQGGQAVLGGLYGDAEKAAKTLEGLKKMSSNSPLEYSGYQKAAESLAYAGYEGNDAIGVLENVGKAITAAGGGTTQLEQATGGVMKAVNNGGIAMMDSLGMISESGVPILSGLAEHFGVGIDEVKKMASDGKVSIEDVMTVMGDATGETFQKMLTAGDAASQTFGNQWKSAKDNISVALGETMLPLIEKITPLIEPMGAAVVDAIEKFPEFVDGIKEGLQWVKDNIAWLGTLAGSLTIAGVAAWIASGGLTAAGLAIKGLFLSIATGIKSIPVIGWIIAGIGLLVTALVYFFTQTESGQELWAKIWPAIKNAAAAVWNWIRDVLWPGILAAWDGIAAGAVWLYQNAIKPAWNGIKTAALAVWDWISNTLWPGMVSAWDAIAGGAIWLYQNAILPAWNGIRTAISATLNWITGTLWPGIKAAWDAIAGAAVWLYDTIIYPIWNAIGTAIAIVVTAVILVSKLLAWTWQNAIAPVLRWLYESVIKPVWNAIKNAISAVVSWFVNTAWPMLKAAWDAVAAAAMWLWNNVMKPVWNGIKAAIGAVVNWFQNAVAPLFSAVINRIRAYFVVFQGKLRQIWGFIRNRIINPVIAWFQNTVAPLFGAVINRIKAYFTVFQGNLKRIWAYIRHNVINPVVAWFRDTAWPLLKRVIDRLKAGFQSMRDRLKTIWDNVKNRVVAPVANWFRDTLQPRIESVTDNIKSAFETMKDGVKKAWDGIKSAARKPAKFVVEDVYNDTIRSTFNGVAEKLGIKTRLPAGKVGFASGGVMPGYTPGRDVHQFYSPTAGRLDLSGGEAIMRPEFTRAVGGPAGVAALNMKARKGQAFAGGGVWGKIKGIGGDAWDWMKDKASTVAEALSDPVGIFKKLASKAVGIIPGAGMVREITQSVGKKAAGWGGEWLKDKLFNSNAGGGTVPRGGGGGTGLARASNLAAGMGLRMTSGYRPGARTARSGMASLHSLGRARDYAGSASQMRAFFNAMDTAPYPTELLYTPMYGRNIHRSGRRYANTGATARGHWDHVHVGYKNGGVFDNGGMMEPGTSGINLTRKPEAVLDPRQTQAYQAHADSLSKNDGRIDLSDASIDRLADALSARPNVVQVGSRTAGQLAMAGAQSRRSMGGR